ncbi:MAG: DUF86 domain-containing protein [Planctomycetota bacterium]|nr:DUF86 domain-containing protein [Planctomycetota bacterium]
MVFKSEAVRERLKRLEEVIARLSAYRGTTSEEFLDDVERQWVVERGFILAAECVADVAGHILSGKFKVQPVDQEDAVRGLGNQRVISESLAKRLRGFGGFRNILVHEYLRIDPSRVHEYLENELGSLEQFVAEVTAWLGR